MALTADQLNTIYNNVLFRNVDFSGIQFFANRTDISDAQVRQQIELSNEATTLVAPIVRLYQEVLGRVPDTAGLKFFVNEFRTGFTGEQIAQQLISSTEFQAKTTATAGSVDATDLANTNQLVTDAFQSILGRAPATSELAYFQGRPAAQILSQIAVSPEAQQLNAAAVTTFLDSAAVGSPNTGTLNGQTTPGGGAVGGSTFTFTAADFDTLNGTAGNDTFNGTAAQVQTTDTVNGGAGTDAVQIFGATGAVVLPTLNSVEVLSLNSPAAGNLTVDASNVTGLQVAVVRNQTVAAGATNTDTFTVKSGVGVGFDAVKGAAATVAAPAAGIADIVVNTEASATTQDVFLANGSSLGTVTLNGTGLTTARLDSAGTSANTVAALNVGATTKTLNITGAQKLTITGALDTDITTVNAAADTGGVTLTANTTDLTVTGGSGNDKFAFAGNLSAGDTVTGGAGTDTISITGVDLTGGGGAAQLTSLNTKVTGVEVLEFTGGTAATIQGGTGAGAFTNTEITKILFNTTDAGVDTINQAGSARNYAFGELNTGAATLNGTNGVTAFNVSLEGIATNGGDVGALTANFTNVGGTQVGTGTLNIASTGTNGIANTTGVINAQSNGAALTSTVLNITGSHDLTIGGVTTKATIDASAFTGKLVVTGSNAGDTITLGSGADTVNEVFTAGNPDPANFVAASASSTYTNLDTINSFTKADTLTLSNVTFQANGTGLTKFDATNSASFEQALTSAEATATATTAVYFNQGGNTYVVSNTDAANSATGVGSTDLVIKITGVQTLTADAAGIHGA